MIAMKNYEEIALAIVKARNKTDFKKAVHLLGAPPTKIFSVKGMKDIEFRWQSGPSIDAEAEAGKESLLVVFVIAPCLLFSSGEYIEARRFDISYYRNKEDGTRENWHAKGNVFNVNFAMLLIHAVVDNREKFEKKIKHGEEK